jgi:hypothetical protein
VRKFVPVVFARNFSWKKIKRTEDVGRVTMPVGEAPGVSYLVLFFRRRAL